MSMPAGKYYIGDLCYVMNDAEWDEFCSITIDGHNVIDGEFQMKDGRRFERFAEEFKGTPASPLSAEELQIKFMRMAGAHAPAAALHAQLTALETVADCRTLAISAA